jgi:predicted phage terminase large subunit-like protein
MSKDDTPNNNQIDTPKPSTSKHSNTGDSGSSGIERRLYQALLRRHFPAFLEKAFHTIDPEKDFQANWHLDLIAEYLKACEAREITRLIINMPPRSLKSVCVSVAWPAWLMGQNPTRRIMVASYAKSLSQKHSLDTRLLVESEWYKDSFPWLETVKGENEKTKFVSTRRGFRLASSVGAAAIGEGADFLIVDDPHNPRQAVSEIMRQRALNWFDTSFITRLNDKQHGVVVVVMQRLHEMDLTGHLLAKDGGKIWQHLRIPAIAEDDTEIKFRNFYYFRKADEVLNNSRDSMEVMEKLKTELGSNIFAGQYQQDPMPIGGGLIRPEWLRRFRNIPAEAVRITQSWDTGIKIGVANDPSCCTTWASDGKADYLLDVWLMRVEYPELKRAVISLYEKWNPQAVLIEDKASGQSLLQDLKQETGMPLVGVRPVGDKIARLSSVAARFEAGRVIIPEQAKWLPDYESELLKFPNTTHDDQVDATSQYLNWSIKKKIASNLRTL